MRFDHPGGFGGLAAVAVLVLLYLYDRRRRTIPVGNLFLWRRIESPPRERQRFRPDRLFWAQLAIVLALVTAYTAPVLESATPPAAGASLVLVLDVSASMQTREDDGSRFDEARRRALARVDAAGSDGEIMILTAAARPRVALDWTRDRARVRAALQALAPTDAPTDLAPAIELARGIAADRPSAAIAVFTDLPPEASGLAPEARAALDYVQLGRSDDNAGIAGIVVTTPPFHGPNETQVTIDVRNYSRTTREAVLEARVAGAPWARRSLTLAPRATEHVLLARPPGSGLLEVRLDGDDALAADDHARAWIGAAAPLDLLLVTDSPALADALASVATALVGSRIEVTSRQRFAAAPPAGRRVVLFDGFVPESVPPAVIALYTAPPAGNEVCPTVRRRGDAMVVDWDDDHPVLAGLGALQALAVGGAAELQATSWGTPIVIAVASDAAFPLLIVGERGARRTACLGAELGGSLGTSDRMPLLLLTLATLRWLAEPFGPEALLVETGRPALAGAGPTAPVTGAGLEIAGEPPVVVAERTGVFTLGPPGAARLVLANLFDDRESDVGRSGPAEWPATVRPPAGAAPAGGRPLAAWLYAAALTAMAGEWALWRRSQTRRYGSAPATGRADDGRG